MQKNINLGLINISLVDGCNLHCLWCGRPDKHNFINLDELATIADKINSEVCSAPLLQVIGSGEAFLHKDIEKAIDIISSISIPGMRKEIWTNGTIGGKFYNILSKNILDGIVFSFDGYGDKESFEYMRKGAKFENVLQNIHECIKIKNDLQVNCQIGVSSIYPSNGLIPFQHIKKEDVEKRFSELFDGADNIMLRSLHSYNGTYDVNGIPKISHGIIGPCYRAEIGQLVIDTKGNVHPCCQDINHSINIGNILQNDIRDIMFTGKHQSIIDGLRNGKKVDICSGCNDCKYTSQSELVTNLSQKLFKTTQEAFEYRKVIFEKQSFIDEQRAYIDLMQK